MSYLLKAFGYEVMSAENGEEGLEAARREAPDLIVCDVQLPKLDGYGVAARLKSHPVFRSIPLLAVTALAMVGDRDKLLAAGFDGYISKPIDPEKFVGEVAAFLPSDETHPSAMVPTTTTTTTTDFSGRGPLILAVDDSRANMQVIRSTLVPMDYRMLEADSPSRALSLLDQDPLPDLIISDIHMRGASGFDFIKLVKADPRLRNIPFVFLTATAWKTKDQAEAMALGAVKFILRPIEPESLLREIEACLRKN
jgi:two-component system cell cycle response regulator